MALWQKESKKGNALYVDILALADEEKLAALEMIVNCNQPESPNLKCDKIAAHKRKAGNEEFAKQNWSAAMIKYNQSLCFASQKSENVSLAYANRSACFLHMKAYKKCLVDIELAKKSGYPKRLMAKLDQRAAECLKAMENDDESEHAPTLSFKPDDKFPCMANVVKIERDANGEYSVIANEDIAVGKTIVVEKPFCTFLCDGSSWKCHICLKNYANLIPCAKCSIAMFCSNECRQSVLHEFECGVQFGEGQINYSLMGEVREMLVVINMFPNAEELMHFVERTIKGDPKELPASLLNETSKYQSFLKKDSCKSLMDIEGLGFSTFPIYQLLMKNPQIKAKFKSKKHRRFLAHLIAHHSLIAPDLNNDENSMYTQAGIMTRYFKHSCAPNVVHIKNDGLSIFVTARSMKKGEAFLDATKSQLCCYERCHVCKCSKCQGITASPAQRKEVAADRNYQYIYIANRNSKIDDRTDEKKIQELLEKCVSVLTKYSPLQWCKEIELVMNVYEKLLRMQFNGLKY